MNEKTRESAVWCVFTMLTSGACRTHSSTDDSIIIWKSISFGAHEWFVAGPDGKNTTTYHRLASPSKDRRRAHSVRPFVVYSSRSSRANNRFPPHACRRKRSAAEKARWATAALIFPGVFARTPFIIDRRLKRAAPPRIRDRCLFWRWVLGYVYFAGLIPLRTRARSPLPDHRTLAALRLHRIPGRWSHWTRSPFIFLFHLVWFFFPP